MKNLLKVILIIPMVMLLTNISFAQQKDRVEIIKQEFEYLISTKQWQKAEEKMNRFYDEYPENPSELDRVEKYEVDQFSIIIKEALYGEERAYRAIQNTKSVKLCQEYLAAYPSGKYRKEVQAILNAQTEEEAWNRAKNKGTTSAYYEYIDNYPSGNHVATAMQAIKRWDKAAYDKAISEGTQSALNYYLNNYPRGEYRNAIRNKLGERKEYDMYMYAKNNNYVENYENYIRSYPNGKYATEVNLIIENSYYKFGNDAFDSKKYSTAKSYYQTYLLKYPNGRYSSDVRSKISKCERRLNQSGAGYVLYTYDRESPLGISFGRLNSYGTGGYMNIKMNTGIFTESLYTIDNQGNSSTYNPGGWFLIPTGNVIHGNISLSSGITYKIIYPLWGYLGLGLGYNPRYDEIDEYTSSGSFYETYWMRNTDETSINLFFEGGANLKISKVLVLKYGIMYREGVIHQLGLGFQF